MNPTAPTAMRPLARARRASPAGSRSQPAARTRPIGSSHTRPCRIACTMAGALSLPAKSFSHATPRIESCNAYHGTARKPTAPTTSHKISARRRAFNGVSAAAYEGARRTSTRGRADVLFPPVEQPLARLARAELREVVVDDLDVGELRHLRRQRHAAVGGNRVLLDVEADFLAIDGQRPVDEFPRRVGIARAFDDR